MDIIISDTNVLVKLVILDSLELNNLSLSRYGQLKFHGITEEEVVRWKRKYASTGRHRKVTKFGLANIEKAIKLARNNKYVSSQIPSEKLNIMVKQYESIASGIESNSAPPTDNDWLVLACAEENDQYMVTNDDLLYKTGCVVIGDKSLKIENLIRNLYLDGILSKEAVKEYAKKLAEKDESLNLTFILKP